MSAPRRVGQREAGGGVRTPLPTCVCEAMMTIGESPSPGAACEAREPEGYCAAARRGGELPEGKDPSQTIMPMKVNSTRPARRTSLRRKGEVGAARRTSSPQPPRYRGTGRGGRVVGVGRVQRHQGIPLSATARVGRRVLTPPRTTQRLMLTGKWYEWSVRRRAGGRNSSGNESSLRRRKSTTSHPAR